MKVLGKSLNKGSKIICKAAIKVAEKTVDAFIDPPLCTLIIFQPDIPYKLQQKVMDKKQKAGE